MVPGTRDIGMQKGAGSFRGGKRWCLSLPPSGPSTVRAPTAVGFCQCFFCFVSKTTDFLSVKETHYRSPDSEQGKD